MQSRIYELNLDMLHFLQRFKMRKHEDNIILPALLLFLKRKLENHCVPNVPWSPEVSPFNSTTYREVVNAYSVSSLRAKWR